MGIYLTSLAPSGGPVPPVKGSTVEWSSSEGFTLPGAGKLNATFGAFGEQAQLSLFPLPGTWTCSTTLHARVKLVSAIDLSQINGMSLGINSGSGSDVRYSAAFTSTTNWTMDTWYAIELPFATAGLQIPANTLPDFTHVTGVGVQLQTKTVGPTPVPVTLYVDDVWVE